MACFVLFLLLAALLAIQISAEVRLDSLQSSYKQLMTYYRDISGYFGDLTSFWTTANSIETLANFYAICKERNLSENIEGI